MAFLVFSRLFRVFPDEILAPCSAFLPAVEKVSLLDTSVTIALQGAGNWCPFSRVFSCFLVFLGSRGSRGLPWKVTK